MSDAQSYLQKHTNPPVFITSVVLVLLFLAWGIISPAGLGDTASAIMSWTTTYLGWWYLAAVFGFLVFVIIVLFSPYGRLKLGKDNEQPEWNTWSWFSMLFTAGMGIGLVFFGVAEPIFHINTPPGGMAEPMSGEAAVLAMHTTYFHWGMHPWAIYIIIGMSMGYFCFRHDLPLRPASAFYPLIGRGIYGWVGNLIDILAVFGTIFGLATSLGLGASQINSGLNEVFGMPVGWESQVVIIAVVTAIAVTSVMLGLDGGVRRLSVWNMYGAILLVGAAGGGHGVLQPLRGVFDGGEATATAPRFRAVDGLDGLRRALSEARTGERAVMLDVYADWCIACKELEAFTFPDPRVRAALGDTLLLRADVTAHDAGDRALLQRFDLYGPPAVLFFGADGVERRGGRIVGFLGPEAFSDHVSRTLPEANR